MDLAQRNLLWLLLFVPCLLAWVTRGARRRARQWAALGQGGRIRGDGSGGWLAAIACLIVALAQPRWGRSPAPPLPPGRDLVLLVDGSRSMAAGDAVPDRLGVAVEAASSLVGALGREPGNRVAVVAFAGRGVLRCPLTENLGAVVDTLRQVRPGEIRPGGTDLGAGLAAAIDAFGGQNQGQEPEQAGGRTVVVFSDGEDHAGSWEPALQRLRAAGIVVHAVAVGDAEHGHPVPSARGGGTLSYQGAAVLSRRSDRELAAIAEATGGAVVPLGLAAGDLGDLYLKRIEPVARQKRLVFHASERAERFRWFVLAALGLGLVGSKPGRGGYAPRGIRLLGRVGLVAVLGLAMGAAERKGEKADGMTAVAAVEAGRRAYDAGRWAEALAAFERAIALDPKAAVPRYDAAATLFQMERYTEAFDQYGEARRRARADLRTRIDYALGNTALALGDAAGAVADYDACIASLAPGSGLDAVRRDAAVNRRFAVESARRKPATPRAEDESSPAPRPRGPGRGGGDQGSPDPAAQGPPGGVDAPGEGRPGRRGPGGAGGSATAPPEAGAASDRLDSALERVREARRHRLPDPPPPAPAGDARKEW